MTKPLLIMGATSGIGSLAMHEAVKRGIAVRAFARSAGDLDFSDLVTPQSGDARSAEDDHITHSTHDACSNILDHAKMAGPLQNPPSIICFFEGRDLS